MTVPNDETMVKRNHVILDFPNDSFWMKEIKIMDETKCMALPVCTLSPVCSSDIVTDFPSIRVTLAFDGKQPPPPDGGGGGGGGGGSERKVFGLKLNKVFDLVKFWIHFSTWCSLFIS